MGGIIKFVLFMFLAMAFFTPSEGAEGALTCIVCETTEEKGDCYEGKGKSGLCVDPEDICLTRSTTVINDGGEQFSMKRKCDIRKLFDQFEINKCLKAENPGVGKQEICICNSKDCNDGSTIIGPSTAPSSTNSVHLTGYAMFQLLIRSLGVIIPYCFTQ